MDVIFEERPAAQGFCIGLITLNSEKTLNALTLSMVERLLEQVRNWATNPQVACILIRGNGPKAFCAGGDVRELASGCLAHPGAIPPKVAQFFETEYRLDHLLRHYPKPVISWAHGYVLGGGMGLSQTASTRILTPDSRLGMPEIAIGLYPDVGASWFFSRLPGKIGLFLALTGAQINAQDALDLGLAERCLAPEQQEELLHGLVHLNWTQQSELQLNSLLKMLTQENTANLPEAVLMPRKAWIDALLDTPEPEQAWRNLYALRDHSDEYMSRAAKQLTEGCPLSARLIWEQIHRARYLSITEAFQMEYAMSLNSCCYPEFAEGVRARLIDKDNRPQWHWPELNSIPDTVIEALFQPAWTGPHPLANLSEDAQHPFL